jgi:hypothetical protein
VGKGVTSQAAPPGDTSLSALTVHSATDVWAAGYAPDPADAFQSVVAVSHWNGSEWTTLSTAGTAQWDVASAVAAGPDDVWISGGVWPFPPFLASCPPRCLRTGTARPGRRHRFR